MAFDLSELERLQSKDDLPLDVEKVEGKVKVSVDDIVSSNISTIKETGRTITSVPTNIMRYYDSYSKLWANAKNVFDNSILGKTINPWLNMFKKAPKQKP